MRPTLSNLTHSILTAKKCFRGFSKIFVCIFQFLRPDHDCYAMQIHILFYIKKPLKQHLEK